MLERKTLSRREALGLFCGALVLPGMARADGLEAVGGRAFGTHWRALAPSGSGIARLVPGIEAVFNRCDRLFSPWRSDSVLSGFNAAPESARVEAPDFVAVTRAGLEIARRSGGAFDPTVGPLVARWGFGPIAEGGPPDLTALSVASGGVEKTRADVTLDLCGIAKGWALDRAVELARDSGLDDLLFDLGGELRALGTHPSGRRWQVAVEPPRVGLSSEIVLRLRPGAAIATSGLRAQSYALSGRRYGHIIDPSRGVPVAGRLLSVTVIADDAMTADGWATALLATGEGAGPRLARQNDIDAVFLVEETGRVRQFRTGRIGELIL